MGGDLSCVFLTCRALGVALVLSLLFILLLRLVAAPLVLLLIVGVLAVLAYGIYHCWEQYRVLRDKGASITQLGFTTNFSAYQSVKETWLAARESPAHLLWPPAAKGWVTPALVRDCRPLSACSDCPGCPGGCPVAHAHLPASADPHRHRSAEGSQQVRALL